MIELLMDDSPEAIEERRRRRLEEAILTAPLDRQHIQIEVEECGVSANVDELQKRVENLDTRVNLVEQAISSIDTVLIGRDGNGGAIKRLESGQDDLKAMMMNFTESVSKISTMHVKDVGELDDKIEKVTYRVKTAEEHIDMRGKEILAVESKVDGHIKEHEKLEKDNANKKGARQWDLIKGIILVAAGSALTLVVTLISMAIEMGG